MLIFILAGNLGIWLYGWYKQSWHVTKTSGIKKKAKLSQRALKSLWWGGAGGRKGEPLRKSVYFCYKNGEDEEMIDGEEANKTMEIQEK